MAGSATSKCTLLAKRGRVFKATLYGKVVGSVSGTGSGFSICFTSVPPEIEVFLGELLAQAAEAQPKSPVRKPPKRAVAPLCARTVEPCRQALLFRSRISCDANYFATA